MTITAPEITAIKTAVAGAVTVTEAPDDPSTAPVLAGLATATAAAALLKPSTTPAVPGAPVLALTGAVVTWALPASTPQVDGTAFFFGAQGSEVEDISSNWQVANPTSLTLNATLPSSWYGALPTFTPGKTVYLYAKCYNQLGLGPSSNVIAYTPPLPPPVAKPLLGWWMGGGHTGSPSQWGLKLNIWSDFAYGGTAPNYTWDEYTSGAVAAAEGYLLMLAISPVMTSAQAVAIAELLVAGGQANAMVRCGWEQNQNLWFPLWNQKALTAAQFKANVLRIYNAMMSVPGAAFQFVWNPNAGDGSNASGRTTWDTYQPNVYKWVAQDNYNVFGVGGATPQLQEFVTAAATNAPGLGIGLCEYGANVSATDNVAFMNGLLGIINGIKNVPTFHAYFSDPNGTPNSDLTASWAASTAQAYATDCAGE